MQLAIADMPYSEAIAAAGADKASIDRKLALENAQFCPAEWFNFQNRDPTDYRNGDYAMLRAAAGSPPGK